MTVGELPSKPGGGRLGSHAHFHSTKHLCYLVHVLGYLWLQPWVMVIMPSFARGKIFLRAILLPKASDTDNKKWQASQFKHGGKIPRNKASFSRVPATGEWRGKKLMKHKDKARRTGDNGEWNQVLGARDQMYPWVVTLLAEWEKYKIRSYGGRSQEERGIMSQMKKVQEPSGHLWRNAWYQSGTSRVPTSVPAKCWHFLVGETGPQRPSS